ncbi:MAG: NlpC/P60 family protein [Bergeyella sp.]
MKKRFSFCIVAVISVLSLQSCVSNYVVSQPADYNNQYKTNAKTASLDQQKIEAAKKQLVNNFSEAELKKAQMASIENTLKNDEIAKTIRFEKTIDGILNEAESYLGTPYRYGGMTRGGIDCSAFVLSVFGATVGMNLPRVAAAQSQEGENVEKSELQKGDLVFFSHGRRISHVGIVYDIDEDGDVKFIHAATSKGVMVSSLKDSYWGPRYRFAKRILSTEILDKSNFAQVAN